MTWLAETKHAGCLDQYAQSREVGLDAMADEILEIADQVLPRMRDGRIDGSRVALVEVQGDSIVKIDLCIAPGAESATRSGEYPV